MNERKSERSKLVPFAAALRRPDPARVAEFADTARRLQQERAASEDLVSDALRETPRAAWPALRERRDLHTSGALERLGHEIEKRLDTDPREALAIAELAASIADALLPGAYPAIILAQLRAHASRDHGQALSYLGRYDDALRALDRAEEQFQQFGTLGHDRAMVRFCRATLLQHLRRFDEARTILDECRHVFQSHGDTQSYAKCTLATGNLLVRKGDYRAAREVLAGMPFGNQPGYDAIAHLALGWCAIHLADAAEALWRFTEAERLFQKLGRTHPTVRAAYGVGSALLHLGRLDEAITHLQSVRGRFLADNLIEEAGLSGLEIVEAQLLLNKTAEAKPLAARLVQEFSDAGLNRRAVAALAYLNEAIAASSATPDIVRSVHSYIFALRNDPNREFAVIN
ncbi:MAG: tetratricopeptide repeat protein [Acidobacteriota bacterium]|nr:tetratricopeptide repeat protein [Acidobacteriota bacterium]